MLLLLSSLSFAGSSPHVGLALGGAFSSGYDRKYAYTSLAPYGDINCIWHFGPVESWVGASASALVGSELSVRFPSAPLQGEIGIGIGSAKTGVGLYWGIGFQGMEVGGYGRVLFPEEKYRAWGLEARLFSLQSHADVGGALLVRTEFGKFRVSKQKKPEAPRREAPPPVYHEDPY